MWLGEEQFDFFEGVFFQTLGRSVEVLEARFLVGGNVNTAAQVFSSEGLFFVKWNPEENVDMFEWEARGLDLLRSTEAIYIPEVIGYGKYRDKTYLVLEYIDPVVPKSNYWESFGQSLALLHSHTQSKFGLHFDNYIGSLLQSNTLTDNGITFYIEQRLQPQAGMALYKGLISKELYAKFQKLYQRLPDLLPVERPALLHGDLWSGNVMVNEQGDAALIDPAVYYGLREAELAFTTLFGGFDERFYDAYDEAFPMEDGFQERIPIYNLYPLLVHLNLFGTGYLSGIERVLNRF
ncbi:fructosamine kinase family protein [Larkinella humicola]|uniref:Fructosamine kinase family protein n=1 Tax=Larkinella humicola TaxID=2607654 RepID=A0A5N1JHM1_9BACT|nr:fructosamine kinase family protein [Larkinella humicola]KAA9352831.1 fructosamine kinase family protein [Larkinella humicola]